MNVRRAHIVGSLAAIAAVAAPWPALGQTPAKLTVGVNGSDDVTPLLWAKTSGLFEKAGLDVEIQKFGSGSAAVAALVGGSLDIVRASLPPLISAHSRGIAVQLIAPADLALPTDPTEAIVVAAASSVTSGKQLNGATMPVPALHSFNELATRAWIDATGGDSKSVHFVELPISAIVPAIEAGRVAAGMVTDPFLKDALTTGGIKVIGRPNAAIAKRYLITAYVAMAPLIASHRDAVATFARVLGRSAVYTTAHHAEAVAAVAPFWGISASAIAAMPTSPEAPSLDPKDIQPLIDTAARYGIIPEAFAAEAMIANLR
jgi:ABC-type nitrate/sulfonate/bicarbonate transport system substrate-binding protein